MNKKSRGVGLGIALGAALGTVLGVMAGHVAIWLAIGVAIGIAIGAGVRRRGIDCPECAAIHQEHEERRQLQDYRDSDGAEIAVRMPCGADDGVEEKLRRKRSFDSMAASLREPSTPLRMTNRIVQ